MSKQEFLDKLRTKLSGLSEEDIAERLTFYSEMIDDRMEEGLSEEEAVEGIGSVDSIVSQITSDAPAVKAAAENENPKKRPKKWNILLLALGSPVWVPFLIAAIAMILSLYAVLWTVVISLWTAFGALCVGVIGDIVSSVVLMFGKNPLSGIAVLGAAFVCVGLSIFAFFGCKALTKGVLFITKKIIQCIKNFFTEKEKA